MMEKYDFIERLFKDEISDEHFFGIRNLEVLFVEFRVIFLRSVFLLSSA